MIHLIFIHLSELNNIQRVRNEEVRVQVKFIDRGDECLSDISELLKLTGGFETIPPFVHQFSLGGHENSVCMQ